MTEVIMYARRVKTFDEALLMADIRNSNPEGYANHQKRISFSQQVEWWSLNWGTITAWLFFTKDDVLIGFGMIRPSDGHFVPSAGVIPSCRGHGYGKQIVSFLARNSPGPLVAQALKSNPAAIKTHAPEYWNRVKENSQFVYFQSKVNHAR